jgi:hypothetical protein
MLAHKHSLRSPLDFEAARRVHHLGGNAMKRLFAIAAAVLVFGYTLYGRTRRKAPASDAGWFTLFDGTSLVDWEQIGNANWTLADGVVQADTGSGYLVSRNAYVNYELRGEFFADENANSGILVRATDRENISSTSGYEVNIHDKRPDPAYATGAIVGHAKVSHPTKAAGQWNTFLITAKGPQITVVMNGKQTASLDDNKHDVGHIGLQHAAGVVKFRKVEIKPL